jgi:hypothetical protein
MHLYCQCGYPVLVTASWDGHDYHLILRDGKRGKHAPPIIECPHYGRRLSLRMLELHPPSNLPSNLLWWPDQKDSERAG